MRLYTGGEEMKTLPPIWASKWYSRQRDVFSLLVFLNGYSESKGEAALRDKTMLQCFGGRRRTRHHHIQWNEKDCLLYDEPEIIPNPCFRDSGKGQHSKLWQLNIRLNFDLKASWHFKGNTQHPVWEKKHGFTRLLMSMCRCTDMERVSWNNTSNVFNCFSLLIRSQKKKMHKGTSLIPALEL